MTGREAEAAFLAYARGESSEAFDNEFPFYPLTAPGMPPPGPDFLAHAATLGDESLQPHILNYLYRRALYDEQFQLPVSVRHFTVPAPCVTGHRWGYDSADFSGGPRPCRVLLLGQCVGREEVSQRRNFVGPTSEVLWDTLDEIGVDEGERAEWYVSNLVRWPILDPQSDAIPTRHKKDCAILVEQELRLCRPDYILCLGSHASKYLLSNYGRDKGRESLYGVTAMVGRAETLTIPLHTDPAKPEYHTAKVMAITHPASVFRTPELQPAFRDQLALFVSVTNGAEIGRREAGLRQQNIYKHRELRRLVDEIRNDPDPERRIIAVDGEWHGEHPQEPGSYLRTVQFSSKHGEGITVVLRHRGGQPAFQPSIEHAIVELRRLLKYDAAAGYYPQIGGHFFRSDLPWLLHEGLDLRDEYAPPDSPEACRCSGGWDTGLQHHAVNEATSYRLTDMQVRLTRIPVYDTLLKQAIRDFCKRNNVGADDLEGYGFLPPWILHPEPYDAEYDSNYAASDPDATRRICLRHMQLGGLLDADQNGRSSWEPYWRSHRASLGILELEMNGLHLDRARVDELTTTFMEAQRRLLDNFREQIRWPEFNPNSQPQCVELLFGEHYVRKLDKSTGEWLRKRPAGAVSLGLTPIKSTGKRPKMWDDVLAKGAAEQYSPSTDKETLGILGHDHPLAMQLRDLKFITQVLKGPLRPPKQVEDGSWAADDDGYVYAKGLAAAVCADGKVRTHISQTKETGRGASAREPLQNLSKRRETDYRRILGAMVTEDGVTRYKGDYPEIFPEPLYKHPIRSIFCASPGYVLVEADYTGAELAMIAWLSGDPVMIEDVRRNSLPESHPDFYDIHSQAAVRTFRLTCEPTKKGLSDIGRSSLRVAAKNVMFGVPYGRQAEAIARQCREEQVQVSVEECQQAIDFYYDRYKGTVAFLAECASRSQHERWLSGPFGRMRRFARSRDQRVQAEQQRQAYNFPVQNGVADALWGAIHNFHEYRYEDDSCDFRLLLPVHDALLFEVRVGSLRAFLRDERDATGNIVRPSVLRECMVRRVPVVPRRLDGTPIPVAAPYNFAIDVSVELNWGVKLKDPDLCHRLGIDPALLKAA